MREKAKLGWRNDEQFISVFVITEGTFNLFCFLVFARFVHV